MSRVLPMRSGAIHVTVHDSYERALKSLKYKVHRERKLMELRQRREFITPAITRKLQKEHRAKVLKRALKQRNGEA